MFHVVVRRSGPEYDSSRPLEGQSGWPEHASFMDGLVDALATAHEVTPPSLPKDRWTWRIKGAALPAGTAATLLNDLREDR